MAATDGSFLFFSLHSSLYALDLEQISEVCDPAHLWPIPQAPPCYAGAMNFHGDIVAVMNLAKFMELPEDKPPAKIIILNKKLASLAFLVDAINGIVPKTDACTYLPPQGRFAASLISLSDREATLLDIEALVRHAEIEMHKKVI